MKTFNVSKLRALYGSYGYSKYKMSKFEEYDLYVRNKSFLISDNIITFTDTDGKLMALKPDVTLSIVKNNQGGTGVDKVYYDESVYRISNHAYKEIRQIGLECIGDIDDYAIYETLVLAIKSLEAISDDFVLDISHMGILSDIMDELSVSEEGRAGLLSCIGEKNPHGIKAICACEGVAEDKAKIICALATTYGDAEKVIGWLSETIKSESGKAKLCQLKRMIDLIDNDKVKIDFSVVNDMSYYNGIVFKGFINGVPASVLSGGQYDKLLLKMGKKGGAIGFAVYPDLLEALYSEPNKYDVDAVLLYEEGTDVAELKNAVAKLTDDGYSVSVQKTAPEKLRYKKLLKLVEGEVKTLEDNA